MSSSVSALSPSILERVTFFTGRAWALDRIAEWFSQRPERSLIVTARPGVGKTALAARLVQIARGEAARSGSLCEGWLQAVHFCEQQRYESVEPVTVLNSIAAQMCVAVPQYAPIVLEDADANYTFNVHQQAGVLRNSTMVGVNLSIASTTPRHAFLRLFRNPMTRLHEARALEKEVVVLIDGLDETVEGADERVTLASLLASELRRPIPGMRFIITSRPGPATELFSAHPQLNLDDNLSPDINDVRRYVTDMLHRLKPQDPTLQSSIDQIVRASEGNFLFASYLIADLQSQNWISLANVPSMTLPAGLDGIYGQFLGREIAAEHHSWEKEYRPVLGVLVQSRDDGLTRSQLIEISGLRVSLIDDILRRSLPYLRGEAPDGPFMPYHSSFREYLRRPGPHCIYPAEATWDIITALTQPWTGRWEKCTDKYILRNILSHIADVVNDRDSRYNTDARALLSKLVSDPAFLEASLGADGIDSLVAAYASVLESVGDAPELLWVIHGAMSRHIRRMMDSPAAASRLLLQQLQNDALASSLDEFAARAETSLERDASPHARLVWATDPPSGFESLGYHGGASAMVATESAGRHVLITGGAPRLWDVDKEQPVRTFGSEGEIARGSSQLNLTEVRGQEILVETDQDAIYLWDLTTRQPYSDPIRGPSFLSFADAGPAVAGSFEDEDYVAIYSYDEGQVLIREVADGWDWTKWHAVNVRGSVGGLVPVSEGRSSGLYVATGSGVIFVLRCDGRKWLIARHTPSWRRALPGTGAVLAKMVSGRPLAALHNPITSTLHIRDMRNGRQVGRKIRSRALSLCRPTFDFSQVGPGEVVMAAAARDVAMGRKSRGSSVRIWDAMTGRSLRSPIAIPNAMIRALAITAVRGSPACAVMLDTGTVRVYPIKDRVGTHKHKGNIPRRGRRKSPVSVYSLTSGTWRGKRSIVSGNSDGRLTFWNPQTGEIIDELQASSGNYPVRSVYAGNIADRSILVAAPGDGAIRAWDTATAEKVPLNLNWELPGYLDSWAIGETDGTLVFAYGRSDIIGALNLTTGEPIGTRFDRRSERTSRMTIGRLDDETVIVTHDEAFVRAESLRSGRVIAKVKVGVAAIGAVLATRVAGEASIICGQADGEITIYGRHGEPRIAFYINAVPRAFALQGECNLLVGTECGIYCYELRHIAASR